MISRSVPTTPGAVAAKRMAPMGLGDEELVVVDVRVPASGAAARPDAAAVHVRQAFPGAPLVVATADLDDGAVGLLAADAGANADEQRELTTDGGRFADQLSGRPAARPRPALAS
ncbi:MAG: hypothetical protein JWN46_1195 [Acidimicrobiales bacterium]|nr:hypothetical protein [Acidimicrobiales bacterium]